MTIISFTIIKWQRCINQCMINNFKTESANGWEQLNISQEINK